jgi:D-alanyl-D-alanine carboxypeptidase/D-alanyl-D-alanine-endopeptidase (penicillin-binding protein 4)
VDGRGVDADSLPGYVRPDSTGRLFVHSSPPLAEIVRPFLKESQNQIGEMLLRDLGAAATDTGSVETGRRVVQATLDDWGIPRPYYIYRDGSGVSRYNYVSPEALVRLLRVMAHRDEFQAFYEALPIAGVDGTLERRMRGTRAERNARAKTGYVSNARTLSGYVTTADDERLAFSLMANDFQVPAAAVEYLQDLTVERLANFSRRSAR